MMREYQVRICERLGVKFPGPTRHKPTNAVQQTASTDSLFNHFIRAQQDRLRNGKPERLCGLEI